MARVSLGTSTTAGATQTSSQRKIVKSSTGILALFSIVNGHLDYRKSTDDGTTWGSSWTTVYDTATVTLFDVRIETNDDICIVLNEVGVGTLKFIRLTYSSGSWSIGTPVLITTETCNAGLSITRRSNGDFWIGGGQTGFSLFSAYSTDEGLLWTRILITASTSSPIVVIPKGTYIWLFHFSSSNLRVYQYDTSWDAGTLIGSSNTNGVLGILKISDSEIYIACRATGGIKLYKYNGSSWGSSTTITGNTNDTDPSLCNINGNPAIVFKDYDGTNYNIYYRTYNGSTWDSEVALTSDSAVDSFPSTLDYDLSKIYLCYTVGASSPYTIYFDKIAFLTTVQQSILSDAKIKSVDNQQSLLSNAKIVDRTHQSLLSDATIKIIDIQNNILSDAKIKSVDNQQSILSDATIISSIQQSIPSDAKIKAIDIPQSINSDAKIKSINNQQNILSDAKIKSTGNQQSILSDARIFVPYLSKFIYNETIFIVTDTDPCDIIKVDISGGSPTYTKYTVTSYKNAKNLVIDVDNLKFYFSCNNGKVIKASTLNPSTREVFDVGEDKQLNTITRDNEYAITYIGDNEAGTSLFIVDEAIYPKINTDFRTRKSEQSLINTWFETLQGLKINTDFRTLKQEAELINTDLRFNLKPYTEIPLYPLARTDFHVYIGGIQLTDNDLKLDSIRINHTVDNRSTAEFILLRKHDDLNNPTTITNNNTVAIYIKDKLDFTGRIINLNCSSADETVSVQCESPALNLDYNSIKKDLPLTKLNEQIHLYDVLLNDITIDSPYNDVKLLEIGNFEDLMIEIKNNISLLSQPHQTGVARAITKLGTYSASLYSSFAIIQTIPGLTQIYVNNVNNEILKLINNISIWRTFPPSRTEKINRFNDNIVVIEKNFDFIKIESGVDSLIREYKGIKIHLGNKTTECVQHYDLQVVRGEDLEDGTFQPLSGWEYFWYVNIERYDLEGPVPKFFYNIYIGTSMAPLSTDIYRIESGWNKHQLIESDIEESSGYYYIGEAPFKEISAKNGKKLAAGRWVDTVGGLWFKSGPSYDYIQYNKDIATIEYEKIKNINDDIFPITNTNIDLTIDSYLYYGLKLLTRINLSNTTEEGIYKDLNGFPISIKQITIDSNSMKISINSDNKKSNYELQKLTGLYPNEPPEYGEDSVLYAFKFDLPHDSQVDSNE